ncbi:MAG: hypothetical protein RIS32_32 [Actinomycetota bacterium]
MENLFDLPEEYQALRESVRSLADKKIQPFAHDVDAKKSNPLLMMLMRIPDIHKKHLRLFKAQVLQQPTFLLNMAAMEQMHSAL